MWQAIGALGGLALNAFLGNRGSSAQMQNQMALNKDSYKYTKLLQEQAYKYNKNLQNQSLTLSKKLQAYQNDFTTKMASSAHQIEVSDLRQAGLNPILSATGGNGASFSTGGATVGSASVGSGSVGSGSAGMPDYGDATAAYQSYLNGKQTNSNVRLNEKQGENLDKDSKLKTALEATEQEKKENAKAERESILQGIKNSIATTAAQVENLKKQGDAALINAYAHDKESSANAKFQNERARGYSKTESYKTGKRGKFSIFGMGPDVGNDSGWTQSITY